MAQLIADRRDVDFVLHEQMEIGTICKDNKFSDFNKKTIDMVVSEARNLAIKEILPLQKVADVGCVFDGGEVKVPAEYHKVYKNYCDGEWLAMTRGVEVGGQGMPETVGMAANEYFEGACSGFMLFNMATYGAGHLIETFGSEEQKKIYLPNLYAGKWGGTMLLTEPEAGSDVGALTTKAIPNADGTYNIVGNKIFISGGESDMTENIVHPTLARIEGAPEGTKGISLFLVPKYHVNEDGSLGEQNDVVCTGIEHKMGLHGSCTCSLTLGGSGDCIGTLLGEENKGMRTMFHMMNDARQGVGVQAHSVASASYMYALDYARERVQGAALTNPKGGGVSIINHPDVRRILMNMKSYVDGFRSLLYYVGRCKDIVETTENAEEKALNNAMVEVLTPIVKGYISDRAFEVCSHGIQIYGGYGYSEEFPVAQLMRDSRIFMIYEGTNGIQSMDLLGRKLGMNKGMAFMNFAGEIKKTIDAAKTNEALAGLAENFEAVYNKMLETAYAIGKKAMSEKALDAFAHSHPFMDVVGDVVMAWMLLWRAVVAQPKIEGAKKDKEFYNSQIITAKFFINTILPVSAGKMDSIAVTDGAAMEMTDDCFGAK